MSPDVVSQDTKARRFDPRPPHFTLSLIERVDLRASEENSSPANRKARRTRQDDDLRPPRAALAVGSRPFPMFSLLMSKGCGALFGWFGVASSRTRDETRAWCS
jgi:hypothetical protein